jgi:hypothetical protein
MNTPFGTHEKGGDEDDNDDDDDGDGDDDDDQYGGDGDGGGLKMNEKHRQEVSFVGRKTQRGPSMENERRHKIEIMLSTPTFFLSLHSLSLSLSLHSSNEWTTKSKNNIGKR